MVLGSSYVYVAVFLNLRQKLMFALTAVWQQRQIQFIHKAAKDKWVRIYFIYVDNNMKQQKLATVGLCAKQYSHCTTSIPELGVCPCTCIRNSCIKWVMWKPHQTVCNKTYQDNGAIGIKCMDWDGIVGTATHYRLDGPGIKFWWGWDFLHLFRPAVGAYLASCTVGAGFLFRG